ERRRPVPTCKVAAAQPALVLSSSRRRHTRCLGDWSSAVCSSDLFLEIASRDHHASDAISKNRHGGAAHVHELINREQQKKRLHEIGRASCREKMYISVGA